MIDFSTLTQIFIDYGYVIMFLASYIEGGLAMLAGGFLASLGYFNLGGVIFAMFLGDILSDMMWYAIGYYGGNRILRKISKIFNISEKTLEKVKSKLEKNAGKILITVKLTTGLCLATMITSGTIRLRLKKFLFFDGIGSVLWSAMVVMLGYFFGESYEYLNKVIKWGGIIIAFVLAAVIIGYYFFNKRQAFLSNNNTNES